MLVNSWPDRVCNGTLRLLHRWLEWRALRGFRASFVSGIEQRQVYHKEYNKNGQVIYRIEVREGRCEGRGSRFIEKAWTGLDEFNITFLGLSEQDQTVILAAADPLDKFKSKDDWKRFMRKARIWKQMLFDDLLKDAMPKLQILLEQKGMVRIMSMEGELRGWGAIGDYLKVSEPKAQRLAEEEELPVWLLGRTPVSTKKKLDKWMESLSKVKLWKDRKK